MGAPLAVLALGATILGATTVDVAAGGRAEVGAGSAPILSGETPQGSVYGAVAPVAVGRVSDQDYRLVLRYSPRFFLRDPNPGEDGRPLVFHRASLDYDVDLTPSLKLKSDVHANAGALDYTLYAAQATPGAVTGTTTTGTVGPTMGTPPPGSVASGVAPSQINLSVIDLYDVTAESTLEARLAPPSTLLVGVAAEDGGALNGESAVYPRHDRAAFLPEFRYAFSPTDDGRLPLDAEYNVANGISFMSENAELEWTHREPYQTTVILGAGTQYEDRVDRSSTGKFSPIVEAGVSRGLYHERWFRLQASLDASLRSLLYVLQAQYRPTATVQATIDAIFPPDWTAALRARFSTVATEKPYIEGEVETYFVAEAPVIYRASDNVSLEVGARTLFSAPHLSEHFVAIDRQVWGYGAVTILFSTAADPRSMTR